MMEDRWLSILSLAACLVLAGSGLVARRLQWRDGLVLGLAWAAIFAAVTAFVAAVRW